MFRAVQGGVTNMWPPAAEAVRLHHGPPREAITCHQCCKFPVIIL